MIQIPCVIFAGGKSSRMGEDKSLLPFHGYNTLTQYQYSRLKKIFKNVYISWKNKNKFDFKAPFIEDIKTKDIFAPTVGFVSIFEVLDDDSFFAISVDSPFIDENIIKKLILSDDQKNDATIAKTSFGIEPMCGIYHKSIQNSFKKITNIHNLIGLLYHIWHIPLYYVVYGNCDIRTCLHAPYEDVNGNDVHTWHTVIKFISMSLIVNFHISPQCHINLVKMKSI